MFLTLVFVKTIFRHESNVTCFKDVFLSLPGHISSASAAGSSFIKRGGEKKPKVKAQNGFTILGSLQKAAILSWLHHVQHCGLKSLWSTVWTNNTINTMRDTETEMLERRFSAPSTVSRGWRDIFISSSAEEQPALLMRHKSQRPEYCRCFSPQSAHNFSTPYF